MESRIPESASEEMPTAQQVEEAKQTLERVRQAALQQAREADRLVREYPYQSVGLAAALGLIVGLLISRR